MRAGYLAVDKECAMVEQVLPTTDDNDLDGAH